MVERIGLEVRLLDPRVDFSLLEEFLCGLSRKTRRMLGCYRKKEKLYSRDVTEYLKRFQPGWVIGFFVAEELVALSLLSYKPKTGMYHPNPVVRDGWQGKGIGTDLLRFVKAFLQEHDPKGCLGVEVFPANVRMRKLVEKVGMTLVHKGRGRLVYRWEAQA